MRTNGIGQDLPATRRGLVGGEGLLTSCCVLPEEVEEEAEED